MSKFDELTATINTALTCESCGAILIFKPGPQRLVCDFCGAEQKIAPPATEGMQDTDVDEFLARNFEQEEKMTVTVAKCESCGATSTLAPNGSSEQCPFCASSLITKTGSITSTHKPQYILPFAIEEGRAMSNYGNWLDSLRLAPSDLREEADLTRKLKGMYLPFWAFGGSTSTSYTGQRGEHHYTYESDTATGRSRRVKETRWHPVNGTVDNQFDNILIEATRSLPKSTLRELEPWDLKNLVPYNDKLLLGFHTETYSVDIKNGHAQARQRMKPTIAKTINSDIGGDDQTIFQTNTTYRNSTFKHILLPVWISAYQYNGKVYQFIVNARTGEVQGERPYSRTKVFLGLIGMGLLFLTLGWFILKAIFRIH